MAASFSEFFPRCEEVLTIEKTRWLSFKGSTFLGKSGVIKWAFWGNQTIQIYGNFEGFPVNSNALFGLVIYCWKSKGSSKRKNHPAWRSKTSSRAEKNTYLYLP